MQNFSTVLQQSYFTNFNFTLFFYFADLLIFLHGFWIHPPLLHYINWLAIDTGAWFALKKSALDCMDGSDNQARTRATLSSKENRERKREDERYLWRIARWNDGPNSSSFQELYITLVCPLRLLSVTLLQRSTEKNYVPRNATRFAMRGAKYNLVSFDKFLHFRDK